MNEQSDEVDLSPETLTFSQFQALIKETFGHKDSARGVDGTFMWLMEEVGELAAALRQDDPENLREEFADVLAWLATLANIAEVDLGKALFEKYSAGCPRCGCKACTCELLAKP